MLGRLAHVRSPAWFVNAALRTARAFVPALARPDDTFAAAWLSQAEYALYLRMDRRDRDHACRVARALLAGGGEASATTVRAALLHDVGKSDRPYRAWERIAVHVYRPRSASAAAPGRLERLWRHHQGHAERGATMIVAAGGDRAVAEIVRHHHDTDGPPGSRLIRSVDERT